MKALLDSRTISLVISSEYTKKAGIQAEKK